jgi:hypothetical protein
MTNNTELQRLMRLRRLVREIATSLQADLDREQAFRVHGSVRELLERQQPSLPSVSNKVKNFEPKEPVTINVSAVLPPAIYNALPVSQK